MKKIFLTLSLVATVCLLASCSGGGISNIVGTWGLTQYSWEEYLNGELMDSESATFDPANPQSDYDMKLDISHIDGNDYLFTSYEWNPKKSDWKQITSLTVTIENNKATYEGETVTFNVSGNTLTITSEATEEDEDGTWVYRDKNVYKRLSSPDPAPTDVPQGGGGLL
ncbi:MAG: hypothetical protein J6T09_03415 [Bacteroidales bacterium]|nr:hypothetical protein [Bacteroidales bacterium]